MVRRIVLLLAIVMSALVAGAAGAFAQPSPSPTGAHTGTHSPSPTASASEQDRKFLIKAHQGNLAEIRAGRLAQEKAHSSQVRELGARLIKDHTKLDTKVRQVAKEVGVQLPREPSKHQQSQLKEVSKLSGPNFDHAWVQTQLAAHRQTLTLINKELSSSKSEPVKKVAQEAKPVIQEHLTLLRKAAAATSPQMSPTAHPTHTR
ncbi:DUF4142 domain-containing protein [Microtetraspora niveoalba]|uniref:DUF4142 domain-containing protein n=1 Tax=Microtetraspora niveoalba TaxID=46175 RepID=UPI00082D335B|nr:DUF4142 domain-containing protein [Microtetraspora niveoalba]